MTETTRPPSTTLPGWAKWCFTLAAVGLVWLELGVRVIPSPSRVNDTGIFVSIAQRLRAGDTLYVTVWDNKDPLFYWVLALFLHFPHGQFWCELFWLGIATASSVAIARRCGQSWREAVFVGAAAVPLVLTGSIYFPGLTHLPGTALTLACLALAWWGRWALAGVAAVLVLTAKLIYAPVVAVALLVLFLRRRARASALAFALGGTAAALVFALILARRNEFRGYLHTQLMNVGYAQGGDLLPHRYPGPIEHLLRLFSDEATGTLTCAMLVMLFLGWFTYRSRVAADSPLRVLAALVGTTFVAALGVLSLTAIWNHHAQILFVPASLATIGLMSVARRVFPVAPARMLAVLLAAYLLGGGQQLVLSPHAYRDTVTGYWTEMAGPSPEANHFDRKQPPRSFAHLGQFDRTSVARGLGEWSLACSHLMQYPFNPDDVFDEMDRCLPRADVIFVDPSFHDLRSTPRGRDFVARTDKLLRSEYTCVLVGWNAVCTRNS